MEQTDILNLLAANVFNSHNLGSSRS